MNHIMRINQMKGKHRGRILEEIEEGCKSSHKILGFQKINQVYGDTTPKAVKYYQYGQPKRTLSRRYRKGK